MMHPIVDIVGYIKVQETIERIRQLLACIRSYAFLKHHSRFHLCLEKPSPSLFRVVFQELCRSTSGNFYLTKSDGKKMYGDVYCNLLKNCKSDFVINFMEDQFMVMDDVTLFYPMLLCMRANKIDVCKSGFFSIEQNSSHSLIIEHNSRYGLLFENNQENFNRYQQYYGLRFYIGVNFITTLEYARGFWSRKMGYRPHEYEVGTYGDKFLHRCMIPHFELQAPIEDNHGEAGTCLKERNEKKFSRIMDEINLLPAITRAEPWITESANVFLKDYFANAKPNDLVCLEFGAGASTIWFLKQPSLKTLVSVEHDDSWRNAVRDVLNIIGIPALVKKYRPVWHERPYDCVALMYDDDTFDFILIDGRDRVRCIDTSIEILKSGGVLVLDNSEREEYKDGIALLHGWSRTDYIQEKPDKYGFTYPGWMTSVFIKP